VGGIFTGSTGSGGSSGSGGTVSGTPLTTVDAAWSKVFGPNPQLASSYAVSVDGTGAVIFGGDFSLPIDFGGGNLSNTGAFLVKYDTSGHHVWSKAFGTASSTSSVRFLDTDDGGNIYIGGPVNGSIDVGGGPLSVTGDMSAANPGFFVAKVSPAGQHLWSKVFGPGTDPSQLGALRADGAGHVVIAGTFSAGISFGSAALAPAGTAKTADFLVSLDAGTGNPVWSKSLPATIGTFLAVDAAHDIVFGGAFVDTISFGGPMLTATSGNDLALAKLDVNGNHLWSVQFGGPGDDVWNGIAVDGAGHVVLAGHASDIIDLGTGPLVANSSFMLALDDSGQMIWNKPFNGAVILQSLAVDGNNNVFVGGSAVDPISIGDKELVGSGNGVDLLVMKLDPSGSALWGRRAGGDKGVFGRQIAAHAGQSVAVVGSLRPGTTNLGNGPLTCQGNSCALVAKLAP
jgi:hypothetical protein